MVPYLISLLILGLLIALIITQLKVTNISRRLQYAGTEAANLMQRGGALEQELSSAMAEVKRSVTLLDHQGKEIDWLRAELDRRPRLARRTYKILTLGIKGTGKTSLTLKWANPLIDLGKIEGTKIERYQRTVSQVLVNDVMTEHVFEIGDWGGEHIVEALHELIIDEIHGLLLVVDLGGEGATTVDPARVQQQLREFEPPSLRYFFGPRTLASCKTVVLFINKADLIAGTPAQVEAEAKKYYAPLISELMKYREQVDVCVFVGSASYGHSIHHLFSHFVVEILPTSAYDAQLLQRMRSDSMSPLSLHMNGGNSGERIGK
ncbi:MAG: hypothetical protein HUU21_06475 [Polyangiaceae bacterium]|nr:hypothetical protein [Polyangiaceae bacterium]